MAGVVSVGIEIALLWRIFHRIGELKKKKIEEILDENKNNSKFFLVGLFISICQFLAILAYHRFFLLSVVQYITPGF